MENGRAFTPIIKLNMKVFNKNGKQIDTWKYYNRRGKMTTEEQYFVCNEKCEEKHFPRECRLEGKVKKSKDFK